MTSTRQFEWNPMRNSNHPFNGAFLQICDTDLTKPLARPHTTEVAAIDPKNNRRITSSIIGGGVLSFYVTYYAGFFYTHKILLIATLGLLFDKVPVLVDGPRTAMNRVFCDNQIQCGVCVRIPFLHTMHFAYTSSFPKQKQYFLRSMIRDTNPCTKVSPMA